MPEHVFKSELDVSSGKPLSTGAGRTRWEQLLTTRFRVETEFEDTFLGLLHNFVRHKLKHDREHALEIPRWGVSRPRLK